MKKKYLLIYTFLLTQLHASSPLLQQPTPIQVQNYTTYHSKKQINNTISNPNIPLKNLAKDLKKIIPYQPDSHTFLLAILSNNPPQNPNTPLICKKYILSSIGNIPPATQHITHKLFYNIIQTQPTHIIPTLLQWLAISPEKHPITLTSNTPFAFPATTSSQTLSAIATKYPRVPKDAKTTP